MNDYAECLECSSDEFRGYYDGYGFTWYCAYCDREWDGYTTKTIEELSEEHKEELLSRE